MGLEAMRIYVVISSYKTQAFEYCAVFKSLCAAEIYVLSRKQELGGDWYKFKILHDKVR